MTTAKSNRWWAVLAIAMVFTGMAAVGIAGQGGVMERIRQATAAVDDAERVGTTPQLPSATVPVSEPGPSGVFHTGTRKDKMERFRCTQCHNGSSTTPPNASNVAHGDIVLAHGDAIKPLTCFSCHHKENRDKLRTESGAPVDMDHSYQMCGQCHFRQLRDWIGGAHGKRIAYWAGKRVVTNCAACHDPHSPHFQSRWPVTYSPPNSR